MTSDSNIRRAFSSWFNSLNLENVELFAGYQNNTPAPLGCFGVVSVINRKRYATNKTTYGQQGNATTETFLKVMIQASFFGNSDTASEAARTISNMWRDPYTASFFSSNGFAIMPLYEDEVKNITFLNEARQYEEHWVVSLTGEIHEVFTRETETATALKTQVTKADGNG